MFRPWGSRLTSFGLRLLVSSSLLIVGNRVFEFSHTTAECDKQRYKFRKARVPQHAGKVMFQEPYLKKKKNRHTYSYSSEVAPIQKQLDDTWFL